MNYSAMVAVLIEAVKELQGKIEGLERDKQQLMTENASLKTGFEVEIQTIHQRMEQLESLLSQEPLKASAAQSSSELPVE